MIVHHSIVYHYDVHSSDVHVDVISDSNIQTFIRYIYIYSDVLFVIVIFLIVYSPIDHNDRSDTL